MSDTREPIIRRRGAFILAPHAYPYDVAPAAVSAAMKLERQDEKR